MKNKFWMHGVNTIVRWPDRVAQLEQSSWGTKIKQNSSYNWFLIAIPTPTGLDDHEIMHVDAFLRGHVNRFATVDQVHIWRGGETRGKKFPFNNLSLRETDLNEIYNLPDERCQDPLVMCIKVLFDNEGEIIIEGAGARFDERR